MKTITNIAYPALALVALGCFGLSPQAQAVCQEGCLTNQNTVLGDDALLNNSGLNNTAIGFNALYRNTTGSNNTATGYLALYSNTGGSDDTAIGFQALYSNTSGNLNTAIGFNTLVANTTGNNNTATGVSALEFNKTGSHNTATGEGALVANTIGNSNTATGRSALYQNITGNHNTATGFNALLNNTTGVSNTANGYNALSRSTTGNSNIALGANAGIDLTTGSNNVYIGNNGGSAGESGTIRIGTRATHKHTFIAGISRVTVPGGVGVIVSNTGKLGTVVSSERFKDNVQPMEKASEAILSLKPVTFRYKKELDPQGIPQFGLVAEQVEKVNPDLVARDEQGKPYTVRYEAVNAMLLNEFLKEHRKVEEQARMNQEQEATIADLKSTLSHFESTVGKQQQEIQALTAALKAQAAQIQKVSHQLRAQAPAPRVVATWREWSASYGIEWPLLVSTD